MCITVLSATNIQSLFSIADEQAQYYENFDLTMITTPINVMALKKLLTESGYDKDKTQFLYHGFSNGFSLQYRGSKLVKRLAPNLKFRVGNRVILWNKIMKEVRLKWFSGPYRTIPFDNYIQSPVGLVSKDHGNETRLIFHLSYPRQGQHSVIANTPDNLCTVKYSEFDEAVKLCLQYVTSDSSPIYLSKSDTQSAFRILGLDCKSWPWAVLKAQSLIDNEWYFFR